MKHASGGVEKLASIRGGVARSSTPVRCRSARRVQRAETIGAVLRSVITIVIWSIAVLTILEELGHQPGAAASPGAGIAGIALGFGAQSLVHDFLSGMFMLMEDQFGVGDVIDTGVATGTVEGVSLRTTTAARRRRRRVAHPQRRDPAGREQVAAVVARGRRRAGHVRGRHAVPPPR